MLYYKTGDLLDAPQTYIAHQVNCQGKMGAVLQKQYEKNIQKLMNGIWVNVKTMNLKTY